MEKEKRVLDKLGKNATDKITGFVGVVTSVSFDLYGCAQLWITPKVNKEGAIGTGAWLDEGRVNIGDSAVEKSEVIVEDPGAESKSAPIH